VHDAVDDSVLEKELGALEALGSFCRMVAR